MRIRIYNLLLILLIAVVAIGLIGKPAGIQLSKKAARAKFEAINSLEYKQTHSIPLESDTKYIVEFLDSSGNQIRESLKQAQGTFKKLKRIDYSGIESQKEELMFTAYKSKSGADSSEFKFIVNKDNWLLVKSGKTFKKLIAVDYKKIKENPTGFAEILTKYSIPNIPIKGYPKLKEVSKSGKKSLIVSIIDTPACKNSYFLHCQKASIALAPNSKKTSETAKLLEIELQPKNFLESPSKSELSLTGAVGPSCPAFLEAKRQIVGIDDRYPNKVDYCQRQCRCMLKDGDLITDEVWFTEGFGYQPPEAKVIMGQRETIKAEPEFLSSEAECRRACFAQYFDKYQKSDLQLISQYTAEPAFDTNLYYETVNKCTKIGGNYCVPGTGPEGTKAESLVIPIPGNESLCNYELKVYCKLTNAPVPVPDNYFCCLKEYRPQGQIPFRAAGWTNKDENCIKDSQGKVIKYPKDTCKDKPVPAFGDCDYNEDEHTLCFQNSICVSEGEATPECPAPESCFTPDSSENSSSDSSDSSDFNYSESSASVTRDQNSSAEFSSEMSLDYQTESTPSSSDSSHSDQGRSENSNSDCFNTGSCIYESSSSSETSEQVSSF